MPHVETLAVRDRDSDDIMRSLKREPQASVAAGTYVVPSSCSMQYACRTACSVFDARLCFPLIRASLTGSVNDHMPFVTAEDILASFSEFRNPAICRFTAHLQAPEI